MNKLLLSPTGFAAVLKSVGGTLLLLLLAGVCHQPASAQYLTTTRAGFVNRVEGQVIVQRVGNEENEAGRASLGTQLKEGDQLATLQGSRAEILLSPGSYLRLNENSRVRALGTRFSAMRFEILKGSVIAEVSAEENTTIKATNPLEIVTPHGSIAVAKTGVYRFDVQKNTTEVSAFRGECFLGTRDALLAKNALKISKGKTVRLNGSNAAAPELAKIDRPAADDFDEWSFQRAETLVAAHHSVLSRSSALTSLTGGWIFDPFYNCYTFVPFGRRYYTPYGFGFYNSLSACSCGSGYWYPYYGSGPYNNVGTGTGSSVNPSSVPRLRGENDRSTTVSREVSVGRRVDPGEPATTFSRSTNPGFSDPFSRGVDSSSRAWGGSTVSSPSATSTPAPSAGRTTDGGSSGSGRSTGGRGVN